MRPAKAVARQRQKLEEQGLPEFVSDFTLISIVFHGKSLKWEIRHRRRTQQWYAGCEIPPATRLHRTPVQKWIRRYPNVIERSQISFGGIQFKIRCQIHACICRGRPGAEFVQQAVAQLPWVHLGTLPDKLRTREERDWYLTKAVHRGGGQDVVVFSNIDNH